jgi:hypothetical protein
VPSQLTLPLEDRRLRAQWKAGAARLHFGSCNHCAATEAEDGRPLLVARQDRSRHFLCFPCWASRRKRHQR